MLDKLPINFKLLSSPVNWLIVILTFLIGTFALSTINSNSSAQ